MDTMPALDTFAFINGADPVFIVGDRLRRAGLSAGSYKVGDRPVGTGFRTHTALLALAGIDPGAGQADLDSSETAGIITGFSRTESAVIRYRIGGDRTAFTGRRQNLDDVLRSILRGRI